MRFFFILAVVAAGLIWGAYFALIRVGLIEEGCPAVSAQGGQVVIDNRLSADLRVRLHDATTIEMRVGAGRCVLVDIVRLKVAVESWSMAGGGVPLCVTELLPAQKMVLYERGGVTYCDIGRADINLN